MSMPRILNLSLRVLLITVISLPFIIVLLTIQTNRAIPLSAALSPEELNMVEQLLLESAPSSTAQPSQQTLQLEASELNLLLRYALEVLNLSPNWSGEADLQEQQLQLNMSMAVLDSGLPLFFNLESSISSTGQSITIDSLKIGNLELPKPLADYVATRMQENLAAAGVGVEDYQALVRNIQDIQFDTGNITLTMLWEPDLIESIANRARQMFVPEEDKQRIIEYYEEIRRVVATIPTDIRAVSLNTFLIPLFNHAQDLTQQGSNPIAENRAALQALAIYVNDENISQAIGTELATSIEPIAFTEVRLLRRQDLAQHLVSIAAISSSAGAGFAQLLSTTKEAYDARYRSGFSFSDLTANTVGVTLATFATSSPASAEIMQQRLSSLTDESDYMPTVGNSRDGLSEADFSQLYRDTNSAEYEQRVQEIQQLIYERPLFEGLR